MLRTRTLEYVHIDDICELFGLNMREFSFPYTTGRWSREKLANEVSRG